MGFVRPSKVLTSLSSSEVDGSKGFRRAGATRSRELPGASLLKNRDYTGAADKAANLVGCKFPTIIPQKANGKRKLVKSAVLDSYHQQQSLRYEI